MEIPKPYRNGKIHVLSERCSTCVFRPGNLMKLNDGRLQGLIESNRSEDTAFACHQTLYGQAPAESICRGYFDAYGDEITPLRMGKMFGIIEEVDPPKKEGRP